jgi:hypothetical protein
MPAAFAQRLARRSTTRTVSYERASDRGIVTETLHQGTTETGGDGDPAPRRPRRLMSR